MSKKHEFTHIGMVEHRLSWAGSKNEWKSVWLRGTAKRWYAKGSNRFWSKETKVGQPSWAHSIGSIYRAYLDLSTVRRLTTEELRAPLVRRVEEARSTVQTVADKLRQEEDQLADAVRGLADFDDVHPKEEP